MKVSQNKVVLFHYALINSEGEVLDGSANGEPLPYLHGHKNIVPGLESAMNGRSTGDKFQVKVSPDQGYGLRDEAKVQIVDKASFEGFGDLQEGMVCQMEGEKGELELVCITKIDSDEVTVDGNHPFAGIELCFDVEVVDVREATEEELSAGRIEP